MGAGTWFVAVRHRSVDRAAVHLGAHGRRENDGNDARREQEESPRTTQGNRSRRSISTMVSTRHREREWKLSAVTTTVNRSSRAVPEQAGISPSRRSRTHNSHPAWGAAAPCSCDTRRRIGKRRSASLPARQNRNAGTSGQIRVWSSSTREENPAPHSLCLPLPRQWAPVWHRPHRDRPRKDRSVERLRFTRTARNSRFHGISLGIADSRRNASRHPGAMRSGDAAPPRWPSQSFSAGRQTGCGASSRMATSGIGAPVLIPAQAGASLQSLNRVAVRVPRIGPPADFC